MILLNAFEVAVKQRELRLEEARNPMRLILNKSDVALNRIR